MEAEARRELEWLTQALEHERIAFDELQVRL
jgi:hypothetical protein